MNVVFDATWWERELRRLNPGRDDISFRRVDGGMVLEYGGEPPVMPPSGGTGHERTCDACRGRGLVTTNLRNEEK